MSSASAVYALYIGRKPGLAEALETHFGQYYMRETDAGPARPAVLTFSVVTSQKMALQQIRKQLPNIVLVELENKTGSRVRFCEMVRYRLPSAAILAIASQTPEEPFPFDGWIKVPVTWQQVHATLHEVNQRCDNHLLQRGPLSLNLATRTVTTPKGEYAMTPKQCALLQMLMVHHGKVVKRSNIMKAIWETSYLDDTRTLDVHIRWLRERIEPDPSDPVYLKTVRGVGYCLSLV
jgi:DNA-binding response OmpR family regulator